ncbi:MAG TPA: T9SS type A sorting domain-containing protein [Candidatus Marinimicrobia bacterium]|nr:T9SS type A sorting domain-containing protein [Candidatus Neomarinimicrobiota bacterium]
MKNKIILTLLISVSCLLAAGESLNFQKTPFFWRLLKSNSAEIDVEYHKIGRMWMRVTNFSMIGDDSYTNRTPSADWPGGSGNSYLYRGSLWIAGVVDGVKVVSTTEEKEFTPLTLIEKSTFLDGNAEHTVCKFWDGVPVSNEHVPLGLEITQHTYAYGLSSASDFVLYKFVIKNVGVDKDKDGVIDSTGTIYDFHFTFRMDGDVSKLPSWAAEDNFVNRDDHAMCLTAGWDELKLFPYMEWQMNRDSELWNAISAYQGDSTLTLMFDGDNRSYDSEVDTSLIDKDSYFYANPHDDFGNPNPYGVLQSPGVLGMKMLHTQPYLKPKSYTTSFIGQDFTGDAAKWTNAIGKTKFDKLFKLPPFQGGGVNEGDYRAITTFGPLDSLATGDSVIVIMAVGVGCDPLRGGVYSFLELVKSMEIAKQIVNDGFDIDLAEFAPASKVQIGAMFDDNNDFIGADIAWDPAGSMAHSNFHQFTLRKSNTQDASGAPIWETLSIYTKDTLDALLSASLDNMIHYFDEDVQFGYDYTYELMTESVSEKYGEVSVKSQDFITATGKSRVSNLEELRVVPNPYYGSAPWNNPEPADDSYRRWKDRLFFINVPEDAEIRIFTLDGDFVRLLKATDIRGIDGAPETNTATAEWDLISVSNREVAPGVYLYHVKSSVGEKTGKFVIIK